MSIAEIIGYVNVLGLLVLGFLQWRRSVAEQKSKEHTEKASALSVNSETLVKLSRRIDELERRDDEKERRIDELEQENRKLRKAFTRAVAYIRVKLPNEPLPDFMLDTGDLTKGGK